MQGNKKQKPRPAGAPQWMATFADLSTLLMCFFVLLLSFSEMDIQKYKQVMGSMREAFGIQRQIFAKDNPTGTSYIAREFSPGRPDPTPIKTIQQQATPSVQQVIKAESQSSMVNVPRNRKAAIEMDEALRKAREAESKIRELLKQELNAGLVELERMGRKLILRIPETGSFPSGEAELIEPFSPVIVKLARAIELTEGDVLVSGHTDNVPIYNEEFRSNWDLSAARAATVVLRILQAIPLDPKRITVQGHADTRPIAPNDTPVNRALNRRVELALIQAMASETIGDVEGLEAVSEEQYNVLDPSTP
ncbi:MAG: MotB family protein [Pseudomonadota bacterium]|nr:MotB family protein [Pseudomonadota bacterium]